MNKRLIGGMAAFAAAVAVAAVVVVGSSASSPAKLRVAAESGPTIAFSTTTLGDVFNGTLNKLVVKAAAAQGLNLLPTLDSNRDIAKQITGFSTALGEGVKGILTIVVDGKAIKPALDKAQSSGVPVVALDTGPTEGHVAMVVTVSSYSMGQQACRFLAARLHGHGVVLEIQGALSSPVGLDRSRGFDSCIRSRYPHITVVARPADWLAEKATTAAQTVLTTNKRVNGIYLASDSVYLQGVLTVLQRLGRLKPVGSQGHMPIVAIDGSPFALAQVRANKVDGVISQPLTGYAKYGLEYLKEAIAGKKFSAGATSHNSVIVTGPGGNLVDTLKSTIVTKANANSAALWGNQTH
jgi:ribose transport system substrate-binding protein